MLTLSRRSENEGVWLLGLRQRASHQLFSEHTCFSCREVDYIYFYPKMNTIIVRFEHPKQAQSHYRFSKHMINNLCQKHWRKYVTHEFPRSWFSASGTHHAACPRPKSSGVSHGPQKLSTSPPTKTPAGTQVVVNQKHTLMPVRGRWPSWYTLRGARRVKTRFSCELSRWIRSLSYVLTRLKHMSGGEHEIVIKGSKSRWWW